MTTDLQAGPLVQPAPPIQINIDPAEWPQTPAPVALRLRTLRRERENARLVWRSISDERRAAWENKRAAEARLTSLAGQAHSGFTPYPRFQPLLEPNLDDSDHPEVKAVLKRLATAKAEIERLDSIVAARANPYEQLGRLVDSIERYFGERLRRLATITVYDGPKPSLQKRDTPLDAVERCRRRLRELAADRHRVASAPWHAAEAKRRARAEIDKFAARGEPRVSPLVESHNSTIAWSERPMAEHLIAGRLVNYEGDPSALPLLFWLHRDIIVERIEAAVDAVSDDANALTIEQRTDQMQVIDRDRLAIEREEEFWIGQAINGGATILRRPDADPRAVLTLGDDMPAP